MSLTRLSSEQAAVVKGLLARGENMHDIAAYYGVNSGRIGELAKGYITRPGKAPKPHPFRDVKPAPASALPAHNQLVPWGFILAEMRMALAAIDSSVASARGRLDRIERELLGIVEARAGGRLGL